MFCVLINDIKPTNLDTYLVFRLLLSTSTLIKQCILLPTLHVIYYCMNQENFTDTMASYSGSVIETSLNRISQLDSKVIEPQHKVCQSSCKCSCNSTVKSTNYANRTVSRSITEKNISGTVKWFHVKRGLGFITRNDTHKDVFVHRGSISRLTQTTRPSA